MSGIVFILIGVVLLTLWAAFWLPLLCCRNRKRAVSEMPPSAVGASTIWRRIVCTVLRSHHWRVVYHRWSLDTRICLRCGRVSIFRWPPS